ncbi:MAG: multifunctional oxoglutarate decarboxylase/oxoglutarate dehydrogenase thiamine pyrophosphate-binding subunit/dihydrolipoyllysine-residue succinyltransferase subunit [Ignavibacterium sp.]|nr:multifunctional oxoglutarate decarboxylase/oxoglutarate dehydrogenase thiamine pyrophosphate-binding subunit/dihydrolipoyllysine-residue succinyltransferase subunit [Ignavibacterium sp.]
MKTEKLTKKQKEELEKFGANTWFVESLYKQYEQRPDEVPDQWKNFFGNVENKNRIGNENINESTGFLTLPKNIQMPLPDKDDEVKVIAGSAQRILDNMNSSLTIPVATSQRTIAVKLLEENRIIINQYLQKNNEGKISFTHIISWAILKGILKVPAMNNGFSIIDGKPSIIIRKNVNLGLAIDIERKDGTRSLLVPNIKAANNLSFKEFWKAYEDIVARSRKGTIDPSEFLGTTVTLTNPGTIGTVSSIPRLMIGQGAILATGAIQYNAEYQAMSQSTISSLGISKVMNISSTYDHRIIQGAESGMFLREINELLLGKDGFYEEIFNSLKIPSRPMQWESDYQPGVFDNSATTEEIVKQAKVLQLINMYRVRGHLLADLDPLGTRAVYHPELDPSSFNLTVWDLDRHFITGGFGALKTATLREVLNILQKTYCEKIGVEYMHIQNPAEKVWLQSKMEPSKNSPSYSTDVKKNILDKLIKAELFENFVHTKFVGHKRFSLEGSETLIPVLDKILNLASDHGINEIVLGMSHRGRLNVLTNIIGKSYESIFSEFEDIKDTNTIQGSGDVKYHLGATGKYSTANGKTVTISVASNPSHLEWVDPVVEGIVRAKQTRLGDDKAHQKVMPLLIHGDAAFAGQGVVAETLNLSQLSGYRTGGTVHIIVNNQIGFTTTPEDSRSTTYATDVAKMIQAPIFHVNGDNPEAAIWVTQIALEYKIIFKKDVVIDLFGYRRHGHNEGDEPGFTQPLLYDKIKSHLSVRKLYTQKLIDDGILTVEEVDRMHQSFNDELSKSFELLKRKSESFANEAPLAISKKELLSVKKVENTGISEETLKEIIYALSTLPSGFNGHPKLEKFLEKRKKLIDGSEKAEWALAESIAFGSLLLEGTPVRLSGQDSVRGTFSQRHIAFTDIKSGKEYFPLNHISENQARLEALDSSLSEAAVLGFEYGYSIADPLALVLWEAQFGDFANGAQIIIDNFIVASFEKWGLPNSVVMLLPHGYEGQGPEHSSARLERFLILCAEDNLQVCNITTPAQYFHILRRQIKQSVQKPLVIMTPKSMLRLPEAKSSMKDFISGRFEEILDDETVDNKGVIKKVIITSGKVFYDLTKFRSKNGNQDTAIIRIEQFYPFKEDSLKNILMSYPKSEKIVWVQEEPKNMGGWNFISNRISNLISANQELICVSRPEGASPAVGSAKLSNQQQIHIIEQSFNI